MTSPVRTCSVPDCDRTYWARGWCQKHYSSWYEKAHPRSRASYSREYKVRNREKVLAWKRKSSQTYRERNPDAWRHSAYLRKFGITVAQYDEMLLAQKGVCAICAGSPVAPGNRLHVDHDHKTDAVRGLLCGRCNRAIGLLNDDADLLASAVRYLRGAR